MPETIESELLRWELRVPTGPDGGDGDAVFYQADEDAARAAYETWTSDGRFTNIRLVKATIVYTDETPPTPRPETRETRLDGLIEEFSDDQDASDVRSDTGRYCLVERHVAAGHHWLTVGDDVQGLAEYHVNQEMAENWAIEKIVDLDTGERVTARVEVELG